MPSSSSATPTSAAPKPYARVAIVGLETAPATILRACFKQFSIETVLLTMEEAMKRLRKEKFEACVLRLQESATALLTTVRTSPSNHRMVIYGIAGTAREALKFSQQGINAVINDPVDRQNALRVIRSTHLLVLHELRRYVRIPMLMQLDARTQSGPTQITMLEISGGGMSVETTQPMKTGESVEVFLTLPNRPILSLKSRVAWSRPDAGVAGLRFEGQEQNRFVVKNWIDSFLDIS